MAKKVLITGINGFIGKNLSAVLEKMDGFEVDGFRRNDPVTNLSGKIRSSDVIVHLAGANRPKITEDFYSDNVDFTRFLVDEIIKTKKPLKIIFSSSTQALNENDYGKSKLQAENVIVSAAKSNLVQAFIYRLPNVFGKWGRPNYNSVVATFCYNVSREIPFEIHNPDKEMTLVYIDDVIRSFIADINKKFQPEIDFPNVPSLHEISVAELAEKIRKFHSMRKSLHSPDVSINFVKNLYSTYVSYLDTSDFAYSLPLKKDDRGDLFELIKNEKFGQIFISHTKPGITRGNHFHHTKVEKFCVVRGEAVIRFRKAGEEGVIEYKVSGEAPTVVDIPPGYTHNITNTGNSEMITLFWANEIFNPDKPDTFFDAVEP